MMADCHKTRLLSMPETFFKKMIFLVAIQNVFNYCLRSVNERQVGYQMLA